MKLISGSIIETIKAALQDVTDTFFVNPVQYYQSVDSLDRFNEDRKNEKFITHNLLAGAEYPENQGDEIKEYDDGKIDRAQVRLRFNYRDLEKKGLITDTFFPVFQKEKDYFRVHGVLYKVSYVGMDGAFDEKNVIIMVHGLVQIKQTL